MTVLLRNTFKAWIDRAPGAPPRLIMIGDVRMPTNGWRARLTKRFPQGINPKILILRKNLAAKREKRSPSSRFATKRAHRRTSTVT